MCSAHRHTHANVQHKKLQMYRLKLHAPHELPLQTRYVEAIASTTTNYPCNTRVERIPRCRPHGPTFFICPTANRVLSFTYRTGNTTNEESRPARPGPTPGELVLNYFRVARNYGTRSPTAHTLCLCSGTAFLAQRKIKECGTPTAITTLLSRHLLSQKARNDKFILMPPITIRLADVIMKLCA